MRPITRTALALVAFLALASGLARAALLTVNNLGGGDYTTIQDAFNALPATFTENVTLNVVATGTDYAGAVVGGNTMGSYRLNVVGVGGRPQIALDSNTTGLDLNQKPVTVQGFSIIRTLTADNSSSVYIGNVGQNAVISDNRFLYPQSSGGGPFYRERVNALGLSDYSAQTGTVIERNYFRGASGNFVGGSTSYGGTTANPLVIRNNITEQASSLLQAGSAWGTATGGSVYLLNNTALATFYGRSGVVHMNHHASNTYLGVVVANNLLLPWTVTTGAGIYFQNTTTVPTAATVDYNFYSSSLLNVGNLGGTTYATLAAWEAALAGGTGTAALDEAHGLYGDPSTFLQLDTDSDPTDFLWAKGALPQNAGMPSGTILPNSLTLATMVGDVDFFGNPRVRSRLDIGAFEVPEPGSLALLGLAAAELVGRRRRKA